jgi:hypothetical protein
MGNARKTGGKRKRKSKRKSRNKEPNPFVLIVCEGGETEPIYFDELRQNRRLQKELIEIVGGKKCGTDPWGIVKYARRKKREKKSESSFSYDSVWCVFDCNSHDPVNRSRAFNQAEVNQINIAYSNPCFELWYLLHYQEQAAYIERDKCISELKKHIPDYNKAKTGLYLMLFDQQDTAIRNAEELRLRHIGNGNQETENPSTGVGKLVQYLNEIEGV